MVNIDKIAIIMYSDTWTKMIKYEQDKVVRHYVGTYAHMPMLWGIMVIATAPRIIYHGYESRQVVRNPFFTTSII
jgi:hypothetical protein